jgi:hypothetical protein
MKGKSTIDAIFVLQSLASKYLGKEKGRFYAIFVDFSKAFDSVPHSHLFYSLLTGNLHGKVITVLRNMYSKLKSCVGNNGHLSEFFSCTLGTRQGCMMSPIIFTLYLNELIHMIDMRDCQGIYVNETFPNVNMLLYADDIVIVGDQVNRVQRILNTLTVFCSQWGLKVNMSKTQAMVYRNGGIVKKNEVFYYNNVKIDVVPYYKYLGVTMSTRLSWSPAQTLLARQTSKALHAVNEINFKCGYSFSSAFNIFDKCVTPILTYGSEIWGVASHEVIENIHFKFCKQQIGVGIHTPNLAAIGECGRDRMYVLCYIKAIKYWLKLIALEEDCLLHSCYMLLYRNCLIGKTNWASKIKDILCMYGFGWAWESQSVPDVAVFLNDFCERVRDCELQRWSDEISKVSKLSTYNLFKESRGEELYLTLNLPRRLLTTFARFRTGSHNLQIEVGRRYNLAREDRLCKFCGENENINVVEDEYHVLLECSCFSDIRNWYIGKHVSAVNLYNFVNIMKSKDRSCILDVSHFIHTIVAITY